MEPRAIGDLCQLSDAALFETVAEGLQHIRRNVHDLIEEAKALEGADRGRGVSILTAIAEEEAAKYLVLIDAIRCPRKPPKPFAVQLKRFGDHLAKGLYVEAYRMRPATFGEIREIIDRERKQYYLDGPNDIDFIFRNRIGLKREELLYVDYVRHEQGCTWWTPQPPDMMKFSRVHEQLGVLGVVNDLDSVGFSTAPVLSSVAASWRQVTFDDSDHWMTCRHRNVETLRDLGSTGLLASDQPELLRRICDRWMFPLHAVDMSLDPVALEDLRQRQREWNPHY